MNYIKEMMEIVGIEAKSLCNETEADEQAGACCSTFTPQKQSKIIKEIKKYYSFTTFLKTYDKKNQVYVCRSEYLRIILNAEHANFSQALACLTFHMIKDNLLNKQKIKTILEDKKCTLDKKCLYSIPDFHGCDVCFWYGLDYFCYKECPQQKFI